MPLEDFALIEFGVCIHADNQTYYYRIPIDDSVRSVLSDMMDEFNNAFLGQEQDIEPFSPSEKYGSTEKLRTGLNQEGLQELRTLYLNNAIPVQGVEFSEIVSSIDFYFGIFHHINGTKLIGIKRPAQFKALLRKKLIRFFDDTLMSVPDDIFKLDNDFDFVIHDELIDILHPSGFIFISDLDEQILSRAADSTRALVNRINYINFVAFADFVGTSKTCAKLVASIKARPDLEITDRQKLIDHCQTMGITITESNGLLKPADEHIVDFLRVLDRREYEVDLTTAAPETYIASSRQPK